MANNQPPAEITLSPREYDCTLTLDSLNSESLIDSFIISLHQRYIR